MYIWCMIYMINVSYIYNVSLYILYVYIIHPGGNTELLGGRGSTKKCDHD